MPLIQLTTFIEAPPERVFDLSRHVSVHKFSMSKYNERIVQGVHSGLMQLNDEVKWQAKHLFRNRYLKVKITVLNRPGYFVDEMVEGDFKKMKHEHYFKPADNGTFMIDQFYYELGYGWLGMILNKFYLEKYLKTLLMERNAAIRQIAKSSQWKQYLNS